MALAGRPWVSVWIRQSDRAGLGGGHTVSLGCVLVGLIIV